MMCVCVEGSGAKEGKGREGTRCRSEIRKEEMKRHEKSSFVLERERDEVGKGGVD